MGAFQAVASGIGQTGEQAGAGINQALNDALKVRAQTHLEQQDAANQDLQQQRINLEQAGQKQAYTVAQQSHDLARMQLTQSGWKDLGTSLDPSSGSYARTFYNTSNGQTSRLPEQGVPPDSPQGTMAYYRTLGAMTDENDKPIFTPIQAKQIAFKMPSLYKEGPAGMIESFQDDAKAQADNGVKAIKIPGLGSYDITSETGRANYSQAVLSTIHPGGLYRALNPTGGAGKDMTGFTPGENREYRDATSSLDNYATLVEKTAAAQLNSEFDPAKRDQISKDLMAQLMQIEAQKQDKYNEILGRRNPSSTANAKNLPLKGKMWSAGQWATTHPGQDVNAAKAEAAKQGAIVLP